MSRAVFLDRDGVLNRVLFRDGVVVSPREVHEFELVPEAGLALGRLKAAGFKLICVTNQPEVARGDVHEEALEAMHEHLCRALPLDDVLVCRHDDRDDCDCRKPKPGLLLQAAAKHGLDLAASFMVGDRWRDIGAGSRAGCRTVFVDGGYEDRELPVAPDATVRSIAEAAAWILSQAEASVLR